jgi:hypothetical protein
MESPGAEKALGLFLFSTVNNSPPPGRRGRGGGPNIYIYE